MQVSDTRPQCIVCKERFFGPHARACPNQECQTTLQRGKPNVLYPTYERTFTPEQLTNMSIEDACCHLANAIYKASALIEQLERAGKVSGNGHHARQTLAKQATEELRCRWL